ncbi:unnamed protein product [Parnassius mnemosyne]|uniref:Uncharacterized protein n=1 Tax=Parnassius mnemosyne TaxID=213953 RepID=A0AAV1KKP6_9NEOP
MPKRGKTLNSQCRELVLKLQDYFERESQNGGPFIPVTQVKYRVSQALGIGAKTLYNINKEKFGASGSEDNVLRTPKKKRRQKPVTGVDVFDADAIRKHIYGYYTRNEFPTRRLLLVSLKEAGLFKGGYAARNNTTPPFCTNKMMGLLKDACSKITKEDWVEVVEKTRKLITEDYECDIRVDTIIENEIVIQVTDSDDSSGESGSESE